MVIDCHTHVCAFTPEHGRTSPQLLATPAFSFMKWRLGATDADQATERQVEMALSSAINSTPELDAAVVLAFDAVYEDDGTRNLDRSHLYVTNEYVIELCRRHPKLLFGASVHPFRKDAVAEIERCIAAGAVLLKWLPIVQGFSPADPRCFGVYEALAHYRLPLLSHTGGERSLFRINDAWADPRLLKPALDRGVTVIAAHCGTRSVPWERDWVDEFSQMLREDEHLYGDTAALCLPPRNHALKRILDDDLMRSRVIHGSDWPIPPIPPVAVGVRKAIGLLRERNWLRRDVLAKRAIGLDDDYWHRASTLLRLAAPNGLKSTSSSTR